MAIYINVNINKYGINIFIQFDNFSSAQEQV